MGAFQSKKKYDVATGESTIKGRNQPSRNDRRPEYLSRISQHNETVNKFNTQQPEVDQIINGINKQHIIEPAHFNEEQNDDPVKGTEFTFEETKELKHVNEVEQKSTNIDNSAAKDNTFHLSEEANEPKDPKQVHQKTAEVDNDTATTSKNVEEPQDVNTFEHAELKLHEDPVLQEEKPDDTVRKDVVPSEEPSESHHDQETEGERPELTLHENVLTEHTKLDNDLLLVEVQETEEGQDNIESAKSTPLCHLTPQPNENLKLEDNDGKLDEEITTSNVVTNTQAVDICENHYIAVGSPNEEGNLSQIFINEERKATSDNLEVNSKCDNNEQEAISVLNDAIEGTVVSQVPANTSPVVPEHSRKRPIIGDPPTQEEISESVCEKPIEAVTEAHKEENSEEDGKEPISQKGNGMEDITVVNESHGQSERDDTLPSHIYLENTSSDDVHFTLDKLLLMEEQIQSTRARILNIKEID